MFQSIKFSCAIIFFNIAFFVFLEGQEVPKLPIGMNVNSNNYWSQSPFRDVMKSSSEWLTFDVNGGTWNTNKISEIAQDAQGYPLELPAAVSGRSSPQGVRTLINNVYKGQFVFTYDGEGEITFNVPKSVKNGKIIITLDGTGENRWINIIKSKKGNHIRNIRILPIDSADDTTTVFDPLYVKGLKPFHGIRYSDWLSEGGDPQGSWETRSKPDYYSQGLKTGVAIEYAVQLSNLLKCDAWFSMPYDADDYYIAQFAKLVRDTLDPDLKIYLEYSNEIWNWGFTQSHYVLKNAPNAKDQYVSEALKSINPEQKDHPEKDAFMMQRTFKIWSDVFGDEQKHRLVRVAAVQHAWVDNTRRVLQYLFKHDQYGKPVNDAIYDTSTGAGCDAISPGGYFSYSEKDEKKWISMDPKLVTADLILEAVDKGYYQNSGKYTDETAKYARAWNVDYVVYEGGQHIQPPQQKEWPFNPAIWEAQTNPRMYDIYMKLFKQHSSPEVDCKLFCAFSYISKTKTQWGSWGHIDHLEQLQDMGDLKQVAPKYQALLDANTPK